MLYKARKEATKFYVDYSLIASEAKNKAKNEAKDQVTEGKGLKILTPKQMLQRLPIALEIRKIVYSLHQSKEITKKYTIT